MNVTVLATSGKILARFASTIALVLVSSLFLFSNTAQAQLQLKPSDFGLSGPYAWCMTRKFQGSSYQDFEFHLELQSNLDPYAWYFTPYASDARAGTRVALPPYAQGNRGNTVLTLRIEAWRIYDAVEGAARSGQSAIGAIENLSGGSVVASFPLQWAGKTDVEQVDDLPIQAGTQQFTTGSQPVKPVRFRLKFEGCTPLGVQPVVSDFSGNRRNVAKVTSRLEAPGRVLMEIEPRELLADVNGQPPKQLDFYSSRHRGRSLGSVALYPALKLTGAPVPNRIELDRRRCSFPIEIPFTNERPASVFPMNTGPRVDIPFEVVRVHLRTSSGLMRIHIPLSVVMEGVRNRPQRVEIGVKSKTQVTHGGSHGGFRLPIVKIPPDLSTITPPGGCPDAATAALSSAPVAGAPVIGAVPPAPDPSGGVPGAGRLIGQAPSLPAQPGPSDRQLMRIPNGGEAPSLSQPKAQQRAMTTPQLPSTPRQAEQQAMVRNAPSAPKPDSTKDAVRLPGQSTQPQQQAMTTPPSSGTATGQRAMVQKAPTTATAQACQALCNGQAQCKAWTWADPQKVKGPEGGKCWLRDIVPAASASPGRVSGVK